MGFGGNPGELFLASPCRPPRWMAGWLTSLTRMYLPPRRVSSRLRTAALMSSRERYSTTPGATQCHRNGEPPKQDRLGWRSRLGCMPRTAAGGTDCAPARIARRAVLLSRGPLRTIRVRQPVQSERSSARARDFSALQAQTACTPLDGATACTFCKEGHHAPQSIGSLTLPGGHLVATSPNAEPIATSTQRAPTFTRYAIPNRINHFSRRSADSYAGTGRTGIAQPRSNSSCDSDQVKVGTLTPASALAEEDVAVQHLTSLPPEVLSRPRRGWSYALV